MRAFVLSGGAHLGSLQVGALQALLESGIWPEMLVGVSAGALNAAWLASEPTLAGLKNLARIWCESAPRLYASLNPLLAPLRLALSDGLISREPLQRFLYRWVPPEKTFGQLPGPRLYTLAARLRDGAPRIFGDDPEDRLLDGLMASCSLPLVFPPWQVEGEAYIDGGVITNLPLKLAIERGADEIIALYTCLPDLATAKNPPHGIITVSIQSLLFLLNRVVQDEINTIQKEGKARLYLIRLCPKVDPGFWNFNTASELISTGYQIVEEYLRQPMGQALLQSC